MTDRLTLTSDAFYEDASAQEMVTAFLAQALANEQSVRLALTDGGGTLSSESGGGGAPVRVRGRWRAADRIPSDTSGTGIGLILPMVFYIQEIRLAPSELVSLGLDARPAADIFAQCLLSAYLRGSRIDWEAGKWFRPAPSRAFAARYLAVLGDTLAEPAFDGTGATECLNLALATLYLSEPVFKNPLLRLGAQHLSADIERNALRQSFRSARTDVLKVVAP